MSTTPAPAHVGDTTFAEPFDPAAPVFLHYHGGHPRDSAEFGVVGYDVIRSEWDPEARVHQVTLTVTAVVDSATHYGRALELAKAHRTGGPGRYGYPSPRYACGCRAIADALDDRPRSPLSLPPIFRDLPAA